jgi:P27 family predicted phage terminase small subunit
MTNPLPDNVRKLPGNPGKRKPPNRPKPVRAAPTPPPWLRGEALAEWKRITPELDRMGLISKLDRGMLTVYCSSWATFVSVAKALEPQETVPDPTHPDRPAGGLRKDPRWQIYREAGALVRTLGRELGLSPNARGTMRVTNAENGYDNDGILD